MPQFCAAVNCANKSSKVTDVSFFRFPLASDRCKKWVVNCRRADLDKKSPVELHKGYFICGKHFETSQFYNGLRNRLVGNAVPTLFEVPNPPPLVSIARKPPAERHQLCLTDAHAGDPVCLDEAGVDKPIGEYMSCTSSSVKQSREVRQLKRRVKVLHCRSWKLRSRVAELSRRCSRKTVSEPSSLRRIDDIIEAASKFLSPLQLVFFRSQMCAQRCKRKGYKWPRDILLLSLQLHYKSPAAYSWLSGHFHLPSKSTLLKFVNKSVGKVEPGISPKLLNIARCRAAELDERDRQCALVFDEMSLKCQLTFDKNIDRIIGYTANGQLATHALVFMVRGLRMKWKQTVAYYYTHNTVSARDLAEIVTECVAKLNSINLIIRCVVCDQAATNVAALRQLGFSEQKPFLDLRTHYPVYVIFDVPHLLKNVRNNFQKYNMVIAGKECSWAYIQDFCEHDKLQQIRLAPRLTDTHLCCSALSKMRVKYAVQVLSHSLAAGINTCIATGSLPSAARDTSDFIEKVDTLFDSLNSVSVFGDKPARCAITATNGVINQLLTLKQWISQWQFNSKRCMAAVKCIWGLQVSITSIVALSSSLLNERYDYVCTSRFNQDCIENFFAGIRSKQGWHENPNCEQFGYAFRKSVVLASLDSTSAGKNCVTDNDFVLINHADIMTTVTAVTSDAEAAPDVVNFNPVNAEDNASTTSELINFDVSCEEVEEVCVEKFVESEETMIAYLAGWIARKSGICRRCQKVLHKSECETVAEHSYSCRYEDLFASKKRYNSACSVGLVLPSAELIVLIHAIEEHFRLKFDQLATCSNVAQKLFDGVYPTLSFQFLFVLHPEHALYLSQKITKLYIVMRIFYAVKFRNRDISAKKFDKEKVGVRKSTKLRKMVKVLHE